MRCVASGVHGPCVQCHPNAICQLLGGTHNLKALLTLPPLLYHLYHLSSSSSRCKMLARYRNVSHTRGHEDSATKLGRLNASASEHGSTTVSVWAVWFSDTSLDRERSSLVGSYL